MSRKTYNIIYTIAIGAIVITFLVFPNLGDGVQMSLGGLAIILTSIFTYSNRHDFPRKRRHTDDS